MNVWHGLEQLPSELLPVVGSIGKCDGVHVGHREILRRVVDEAAARRLRSLLISFDPHPLAIVAPERLPALLQTRRQKLDALRDLGLDDYLLLAFDRELAALDGERFFAEVLAPKLRFASLHVGTGFRFGHRRSGDVALLERIGRRDGFDVHEVPAVEIDGKVVSSSAIRDALRTGDVEAAGRMLGRPYAIEGEVVRGAGRGRELQFPTANLRVDNELLPRIGVYVTETLALASRYPSLSNIGVRPTFGGRELTVETHLLEFEGDLYTERVELRLLARLRDEMQFETATELGDQIARDRAAAISYFQNVPFTMH